MSNFKYENYDTISCFFNGSWMYYQGNATRLKLRL